MAKVIDITEKLNFEEHPILRIKDEAVEVNDDAETVLKIMGMIGDGEEQGPRTVMKAYEMLFSKKDRGKIDRLKLNFKDFATVVNMAIELVVGDDQPGE